MNILHVHTVPVISGSGINTLSTMIGSVNRGHRVGLACGAEGPLCDEARKAGIEVHVVKELGRELHAVRDLLCVSALIRLIRKEQFDVVHTHNSKAGFVGRLAARLAGKRLVIHTVHGFAFHDAERAPRRALFRLLERIAAAWCDGIIFVSGPLKVWAEVEGIGKEVPGRVIYSGIDIDAFRNGNGAAIRRELNIEPGRLVVGVISKLWEGKGHKVLFAAWQKILRRNISENPLLLVVGEGPLESSLRQLAKELDIEQSVRFTGFRSDIPDVTASIDIAVLPSSFEGMGRVVLEAMAAGRPVIASSVGGIPDLVKDRVSGILVAPNDPAALEAALAELISEPSLRLALSRKASEDLRPVYSTDVMVRQIHEFYEFVRTIKGRQSR